MLIITPCNLFVVKSSSLNQQDCIKYDMNCIKYKHTIITMLSMFYVLRSSNDADNSPKNDFFYHQTRCFFLCYAFTDTKMACKDRNINFKITPQNAPKQPILR